MTTLNYHESPNFTEFELTERLNVAVEARQIAADALYKSVSTKSNPWDRTLSEAQLYTLWLGNMRNHEEIYPDGWYIRQDAPPPNGIGILAGPATLDSRVTYRSLRDPQNAPRPDIFFGGNNCMAYLYASPVHKQKVIGDFGLTVYGGTNHTVIDQLQTCWKLNREIVEHIKTGMPFSDIYNFAVQLFEKYSLSGQVPRTDPNASPNIGHTVPGTYTPWTADQLKLIDGNDWFRGTKIISDARKFVAPNESQPFLPGMAVTLEPRVVNTRDPNSPMTSFHEFILHGLDGKIEAVTIPGKIFQAWGMDYMLNL